MSSNLSNLVRSSNRMNYRITPSDVLSIVLVDYPDINAAGASGYPVDQQGFIQFPLIGRIQASVSGSTLKSIPLSAVKEPLGGNSPA